MIACCAVSGDRILSRADAKEKSTQFREDAFDTIVMSQLPIAEEFLCADGCVVLRRGSGEVHLVLQKKDMLHLERYRTFVDTTAPVRKETNYQTYRVSLYSLHLA